MKVALAVLLLVALVSAKTWTTSPTEVAKIGQSWRAVGPAPANARVSFIVALPNRNVAQLQEILHRVSDPRHADYGKWLSLEEINRITQPVQADIDRLHAWLARHNVEGRVTGDAIQCTATVRDASNMFNARFFLYEKMDSRKERLIRTNSYSVSNEVVDLVQFVAGLVNFPMPEKKLAHRSLDVNPEQDNSNGKVVPEVIRDLYHIPFVYRVNDNSSVGLIEFQKDHSFNQTDLRIFQQQTDDVINPVATNHIIGPYEPFPADLESTLDVQYGGAMALNASVWFWTSTGWMYDFAVQFMQTQVVPFIISMSWGWPENEQCQVGTCNGITSQQYVNRTEAEFLKITLRGVTILAASGDNGAPGDGNPECQNTLTPITTIYPGASAYVLSVGATALKEPTGAAATNAAAPTASNPFSSPICQKYDCSTSTTEIVCSYPDALITSGGGFSMYTPQPSWQKDAVSAYLAQNTTGQVFIPPVRYVNVDQRAFPDVSALGHNYLIYATDNLERTGVWEIVDGTSCSTPVWAGIISLFNDIRQNQRKPTLGFINPALYQAWAANKAVTNDITTGNNKCTESCCAKNGFQATTGWDPVTGVGTPNYPALANYFLNLP